MNFAFRWVSLLLGLLAATQPGVGQALKAPLDRITFQGDENDRCLKCHGLQNFAFRLTSKDGDRLRNLTVIADTIKRSVHGAVACQHCHQEIREYPHAFAGERPKVRCDAACHAVDKSGAPYTHAATYVDYASSVHGKGLVDGQSGSPRCETCHGAGNPHSIGRSKDVLPKTERMRLCVDCHEKRELMVARHVDPDAVGSYRQSFHYKAIRFGQTNTAVCQDCHNVHRILPADSAASSVSTANIASTCGQQNCHPGVNMNFAMSGANHLRSRIGKDLVLGLEEKLFVVLTIGTMAMLLVGILLDIQRKYGWLRLLGRGFRAVGSRRDDFLYIGRKLVVFGKKVLID